MEIITLSVCVINRQCCSVIDVKSLSNEICCSLSLNPLRFIFPKTKENSATEEINQITFIKVLMKQPALFFLVSQSSSPGNPWNKFILIKKKKKLNKIAFSHREE